MSTDSAPPELPPVVRPAPRLDIPPYDFTAALSLERELGISHVLAQVLVRRGLSDAASARAWLAADEQHPPAAFEGMDDASELVLRHVRAGSRITVHGDYDADGVCSTALLVRSLRRLGADVDWFLPSRSDDGYGLAAATVQRLAARGTRLLITVDCAITAVDEVAAARAAGVDVLVTDHHMPRADGRMPDAPIVHPALCNYPCAELCATGVALKLAQALEGAAALPQAGALEDLDLVALATVADCVPLRGENRRLVREGLRALAATAKPGLRALMRVAQVDPSGLDAHAIAFRLAPRVNAAGRLYRADAGLELMLTEDEARAEEVAAELDAANAERRNVEMRILFEAEAQVAAAGARPAYVLVGEEWHPGVIGIVASRIAERHHRPAVMVAMRGDSGTGSGRSIPGYDLLSGLTASAHALDRHGGHRAAAGLEVSRDRLDDFRAAFEEHAARALSREDLIPTTRVDAVVSGDLLGLELAEELERLEPFGTGNPTVNLLVPAAAVSDAQAMGEGKHVRFTVHAGGARSRAVAFGVPGGRFPVRGDGPVDATFRLEAHTYNGATEPRLVLGAARRSAPGPLLLLGEPVPFFDALLAELDAPLEPWPPASPRPTRELVDRRELGLAGTLGDLAAAEGRLLVVCADARRRHRGLANRLGGFALCSYAGLEHDPGLGERFQHLVAIDPPAHAHHHALLRSCGEGFAHFAWGSPELRFAEQINELEYGLRAPLAALYRALRDRPGATGEELGAVLRGDPRQPRSASLAGRALRVLGELGLVSLDRDLRAVTVPPAERTALERSAAFRSYQRRLEDGRRFLSEGTAKAA
jgi:single-stranded-DNA-specific exonuclease